nr:hypothetical protein [Marinobacter salexigens]
MLKHQSHIVAPIPDGLRTRALYTVAELRGRGKASKMMLSMAKVGISSMLKGSKMVVHKVLKKTG